MNYLVVLSPTSSHVGPVSLYQNVCYYSNCSRVQVNWSTLKLTIFDQCCWGKDIRGSMCSDSMIARICLLEIKVSQENYGCPTSKWIYQNLGKKKKKNAQQDSSKQCLGHHPLQATCCHLRGMWPWDHETFAHKGTLNRETCLLFQRLFHEFSKFWQYTVRLAKIMGVRGGLRRDGVACYLRI